MHILTLNDATDPYLAYTSVGQDASHNNLFMDIYTGFVATGHGAGHDPTEMDILYPVIYQTAGGKGLASWHNPQQYPDEFRAAVAHTAIAGFVDKTDPAIVHILWAHADLRKVTLGPSGDEIFAVVLAARVKAQNAEVASVGYQVTALRRHSPKRTLLPTVIADQDPAIWDGSYLDIGPVVIPGAPEHS